MSTNESNAAKFINDHIDFRWFGGVVTRVPGIERVAGAIQISPAESVRPVSIEDLALTRVCGYSKAEAEGRESDGKSDRANMGTTSIIRFGVYKFTVSYNPLKARGVTREDLEMFWDGLTCGWENSRAAFRTGVNLRYVKTWQFAGLRGWSEAALRESLVFDHDPLSASKWDDVEIEGVDFDLPSGTSTSHWNDGWLDGDTAPTDPSRRFFAVGAIEVVNSNPNGDPDDNGRPRVHPDTRHGIISPQCIKRVIRDHASALYSQKLFMERGVDLGALQNRYSGSK